MCMRFSQRQRVLKTGLRHSLRQGMLIFLTAIGVLISTAPLSAAPAYPLKKGPTGRYLVDQNDVPFLIAGESPQAMIGKLNEADAELFFQNRQAHGFNTVWINLLCADYTGCRSDGKTFDGIAPFTALLSGASEPHYDLTKPNEAYFSRVDAIIRLAARYGFLVMLDPAETGSWLAVLKTNGVLSSRSYGKYLGQRYASFDNILWMHGNDFQSWPVPSDDAVVLEVAMGIQDIDTRHIHTVQLNYQQSSSLDDSRWEPIIQLNGSYTHVLTDAGVAAGLKAPYALILTDYNRSNFLPTFLVEAGYEFEQNSENYAPGIPQVLRLQEYWSILSGVTGQLYGNKYTWQFIDGWKDQLDTPGAVQMAYVKALFEPRAWYELVPDQDHTVVTAGYGTFGSNDYVTAARTPDGKLVMAYVPSSRTLTVEMSKLSGPVMARWYDPAGGTLVNITGSPFANTGSRDFTTPGNNADGPGNEDWVLVLEAASLNTHGLDNFFCYVTQLTRTNLCTASAPLNPGASCTNEEECGGITRQTKFCIPNKFPKGLQVSLAGRFETKLFNVTMPLSLCTPADLMGGGIGDSNTHLQGYSIRLAKTDPPQNKPASQHDLRVTNLLHPQGELVVDISNPSRLLVPTAKSLNGPVGLPGSNNVDHYECYRSKVGKGMKFTPILGVSIGDQFTDPPKKYDFLRSTQLCVPVDKNGEGVKNESSYLQCYQVKQVKGLCTEGSPAHPGEVCKKEEDCGGTSKQSSFCVPQAQHVPVTDLLVSNQFGQMRVNAVKELGLCVPSTLSQQ
jgi:hypothetical protein